MCVYIYMCTVLSFAGRHGFRAMFSFHINLASRNPLALF